MSDRTVITFEAPLPPRGLRANHATHINAYRARLVREYQEAVWCAGWQALIDQTHIDLSPGRRPDDAFGSAARPWEYARLSIQWRHAGVAPDADNALASLKALIDVLHTRSQRPLGIVVDDSPAHLVIERVELVKVRHRAEEGVRVSIEPLGARADGGGGE